MGENFDCFGISERQQNAAMKSIPTLEIPTGLGLECGVLLAVLCHFSRPQCLWGVGRAGVIAVLPHRTDVDIKRPAQLQGSDQTWCRMHCIRGQGMPLHHPAPLLLGAEK